MAPCSFHVVQLVIPVSRDGDKCDIQIVIANVLVHMHDFVDSIEVVDIRWKRVIIAIYLNRLSLGKYLGKLVHKIGSQLCQ